MPDELRLTAALYDRLRRHLLADDVEHAAVITAGVARRGDTTLLVARDVALLDERAVTTSAGGFHLDVSPIAIARLAKQASTRGETLVIAHSHPFPGPVAASPIDLRTERDLCGRSIVGRIGRPVGGLVLGPDGFDGRLWHGGEPRPLTVRVAGRTLQPARREGADDQRVARQLLVWGGDGQATLADAHVVIVGAGGTGSHVAAQVAHLGVGAITVVDDDTVAESNLSRIIGATVGDVGAAKVDVIARYVRSVRPETRVVALRASVLEMDLADLAVADIVVCCTDGHASRAALTELCAQYLLTLVDLGVEVHDHAPASRAGGGVRVVRPGEPCLHCSGVINPNHVRVELLSPHERAAEAARGYLRGLDEPAPSVIALNGVVASLAVTEVLNELVGLFASAPARLLYRADARAVTTAATAGDEQCYVCGRDGIAGLGDDRPLLARRRESPSRHG